MLCRPWNLYSHNAKLGLSKILSTSRKVYPRTEGSAVRGVRPHIRITLASFSHNVRRKAETNKSTRNTRPLANLLLGDLNKTSSHSEAPDVADAPTSKLLQTVQEYQQANPQYLTLVRVGDFYEAYYEQADLLGQLLGLMVVDKTVKGHTFRFTGFGVRQLERHLETLVERQGQCVAVLEQYQDPISKQYDRKLDRIFTPGTLVGEQFLDSRRSNFLLSLSFSPDQSVGMAWIDLATGEFQMASSQTDELASELSRLRPREVVISEEIVMDDNTWLGTQLAREPSATFLREPSQMDELIKKLDNFSPLEKEAGIGLLNYVIKTQGGRELDLKLPVLRDDPRRLKVDQAVLQCLEVSNRTRGSLLKSLNQTLTKAGSRLLASRLASPSTHILTITNRLTLIEAFRSDSVLCANLREDLKGAGDAQRSIQKLSLRHAIPLDLLDIMSALRCAQVLKSKLSASTDPALTVQGSRLPIPSILANTIGRAYDDGSTGDMATRGSIRPDYNKHLCDLHALKHRLEKERDELELDLRNSLCAKSLKLVSSPGYGHIIELNSRDEATFSAAARSLSHSPVLFQALKGKRRYYLGIWSDLGCKMEQVQEDLIEEERGVFDDICKQVLSERDSILTCSRTIAELDVATTIAVLSHRLGLVRPTIEASPILDIRGARHLGVELALQGKRRQFTPNDCLLDASTTRLSVITGPNMGGKSTYLRQIALIVIMAQAGIYVPAESARVGIVDQLFSRVGSADNLTNEQSTFMVEMQEMATILRKSSHRSMVIVDEIGRGTSTHEGEAIAFSILKYLHDQLKCRTLFATHYHSVALFASDQHRPSFYLPGIVNYHTRVHRLEVNSTPLFAYPSGWKLHLPPWPASWSFHTLVCPSCCTACWNSAHGDPAG
ncbi:MutS protein 1, variant 3 [Entomophthora muscae]|uniref:MutS protein 1, variant 3 n=1 Tax=Entomophthora muscae TaxID=34485 RepID=A0ACC2URU7_9FUNG|nr:MutS protein 1, variant 3 [Entomophthora muscae]